MNIGIIGGADGPTSIFVTSGISWLAITFFIVLVIVVVGLIIRSFK